jgi:hypothetical protein
VASLGPEELVEQTFDDPEETIAALKAAFAAGEHPHDLPLAEDRRLVRARLLVRLGEAYEQRQNGDRGDNLAKALSVSVEASQSLPFKDFPALWAQSQHNLGRLYLQQMHGDRAENIERAIAACGSALRVRTSEAFPVEWAKTQNNLAVAYKERIRGERAENLERAIAHHQAILQVRTREA